MNNMHVSVFLCMCFISLNVLAQNEKFLLKPEHGIDELIQTHIEYNKVMNGIHGYRIQIFSSSGNFSRSNALTEQSRFQSRYPAVPAYVIFNSPYYIVRVGNFRTRLEAEAFRQFIIRQYPGAYIVKEFIELPK